MKKHQHLADLLVKAGMITQDTLKQAAAYQQEKGEIRIDQALIQIGALTGREIASALSVQTETPFLTLDNISPAPEILDLVPTRIARTHGLIPVLAIKKSLIVAVSNPLDEKMLADLHGSVGMPLHMAVAPGDEIAEAVNTCYASHEDKDQPEEKRTWIWPDKAQALSEKQTGTSDFFTRANKQTPNTSATFDIFGTGNDKNRRGNADTKNKPVFEGVFQVRSGSAPPKDQPADTPEKTAAPWNESGNPESVAHFENGLAALQRGSYKEALAEFETALEHDPENRVCKANMQRIQKILSKKDR
ncbi:MAG: tetratricopeptide repeat protein [Desulfobacteraceae bacterium]|nr:tetratricopeptide repeat protein [Desulfobacteraceae bacterium]